MPFPQKYDTATREAATARVLERRATNPKDRSVLRVVSEEFGVGQQSLRTWVAAAEAEIDVPSKKRPRPKFSPVVTSRIERSTEVSSSPEADEAFAHVASDTTALPDTVDESRLRAEIVALRRGNEAIKAVLRVLLEG